MTTSPTIQIAVLLGFGKTPTSRHTEDLQWLREHATGATYAATIADLPLGGWRNQGAVEYARLITVPTDSHEADSARLASQLAQAQR